jgi:nitroreductase
MGVKELVEKRKSIRKFSNRGVSDEIINELIKTAMLAPSGCNLQPWKFAAIRSSEFKQKMRVDKIFYQDFVFNAPVLLICCATPKTYYCLDDGLNKYDETRATRDLGIASAFLVLRAEELGLGSCFIAENPGFEKLKEMLNLEKEDVIPFAICLGFPAETPERKKRKDIKDVFLGIV